MFFAPSTQYFDEKEVEQLDWLDNTKVRFHRVKETLIEGILVHFLGFTFRMIIRWRLIITPAISLALSETEKKRHHGRTQGERRHWIDQYLAYDQ